MLTEGCSKRGPAHSLARPACSGKRLGDGWRGEGWRGLNTGRFKPYQRHDGSGAMVACVTRVGTTCQWDGILRLIPAVPRPSPTPIYPRNFLRNLGEGGNSCPMFPHPIPAVPRLRLKIRPCPLSQSVPFPPLFLSGPTLGLFPTTVKMTKTATNKRLIYSMTHEGHYLLYVSNLLSVFSCKFDQNLVPSQSKLSLAHPQSPSR
ncbi:hypothetical protein EI94DRAFT_214472 [Lactarius quietus]|nr:hypothetical protein EI94DRAFT_214472 [Lactarius quietus]